MHKTENNSEVMVVHLSTCFISETI